MKNALPFVSFLLLFSYSLLAQVQIGSSLNGDSSYDEFGGAIALSADGTIMAVGAEYNDGWFFNNGQVKVFQYDGTDWTQLGQDLYGLGTGNGYGYSVSISADGSIVAFGSWAGGAVFVFEYDGQNWTQLGALIAGEAGGEKFGASLSFSADGHTIVVGAPLNDGEVYGFEEGHARIHQFDGTNWVQLGQDLDGEYFQDEFGHDVAISADGSVVAISSMEHNAERGHVRIYRFDGASWVQLGQEIEGDYDGHRFGSHIDLSSDGNLVAVGAPGDITVRVLQYDGTDWQQLGQDIYGANSSVAMSSDGSLVAIGGASGNTGNNTGSTRLFHLEETNWVQVGKTVDGEASGDGAGASVALSSNGNIMATGAIGVDIIGTDVGEVKVFAFSGVFGMVYNDLNQNCQKDETYSAIAKRRVIIQPGNILAETNRNGYWNADLPDGNYTVTVDTGGYWTSTCPVTQSFTVLADEITFAPSFGLTSTNPCSAPDVSISMPFMRRCFSDQTIYVQACNTSLATGILENGFVLLELDDLLTVDASSLPYTDLGNNQYRIDVGDFELGQCVSFWMKTTLSCDAQLGQGICVEAAIFPLEDCMLDDIPTPHPPTVEPCNTPWDNSSLSVYGFCQNDSAYFQITNTGDIGGGDMTCFSPVTVYLNGILHLLDSIQLSGQATVTYTFPGNGDSWHLEVAQHPLHPGNSAPRATVENCGGSTGQTRVNLFAQDDADPILDIYCGEVSGSYDPNDKRGFPLGLTNAHSILPNQQLEYMVRFQNTGTDTAFTVVIRDTLDANLDIFSVRPGVSSHTYEFKLYGSRVLEWTFNDIMLPDSNVNEAASNGFINFTVNQMPDLPDGTEITNSAGIYFDFNDPIITNTSLHTVDRMIQIPPSYSLDLEARIFLQGPYDAATGLMGDALRATLLPNAEPYAALGFPLVDGGEVFDDALRSISGNDAIIDWILVELRDRNTPSLVVATQSALLQRDGDIVSADGSSPVSFRGLAQSSYHVAIRHRNHLGILTATPITLGATAYSLDFTDGSAPTYGNSAQADLGNGIFGLYAGDATSDGSIDAADRSATWNHRNQNAYHPADVDMDGTGTANDRSICWNGRNREGELPK